MSFLYLKKLFLNNLKTGFVLNETLLRAFIISVLPYKPTDRKFLVRFRTSKTILSLLLIK